MSSHLLKENQIVTAEIIQDLNYALLAKYQNSKIYIDLIELSWEKPIPEKDFPKLGDKIEIRIIKEFEKQEYHIDCDYIGSVRAVNPEQNPWYDSSIYKVGDEFTGTITEIMSFGSWAIHPSGADVRIVEDVSKMGLELDSKVRIRIKSINPFISIDGEIVT